MGMTSFNKLRVLFACDMICKTSCLKDMNNVESLISPHISYASRESMRTHATRRGRLITIIVVVVIIIIITSA